MAAAAAETVSLRLCEPVVGDFAQICAWWVHHIHTKSFSSTEWCKFLSQEMQENHTHFSPLSVWATFTIEFQTTPQNCTRLSTFHLYTFILILKVLGLTMQT